MSKQKRLDRPDREKIARRVSKSVECREWGCLTRKVQLDYLEIADQILPDIEEAVRQKEKEWIDFTNKIIDKGIKAVAEAKKQERERILNLITCKGLKAFLKERERELDTKCFSRP